MLTSIHQDLTPTNSYAFWVSLTPVDSRHWPHASRIIIYHAWLTHKNRQFFLYLRNNNENSIQFPENIPIMHLMLTLYPNSTTTHHNSCLLNHFWHTQRWLEHLQTFSATFKSTKNFGSWKSREWQDETSYIRCRKSWHVYDLFNLLHLLITVIILFVRDWSDIGKFTSLQALCLQTIEFDKTLRLNTSCCSENEPALFPQIDSSTGGFAIVNFH